MLGLKLFLIAEIAFLIPILLTWVSGTVCMWLTDKADLLLSYFLACFTAGFLGLVIAILQFIGWLLSLIF